MRPWHIPCCMALMGILACDSSIAPGKEEVTAPEDDADQMDAGQNVSDAGPDSSNDEPRDHTIDASDQEAWVYFDLASGQTVTIEGDAKSSSEWDLAFKRFAIATNGGASGAAGVGVIVVDGQPFEAVSAVPEGKLESDAEDGEDSDEDPDYVMATGDSAWYDYDPTTHALAPRDHVYVIRSRQSEHYKLRVLDYYNDAGSAGYLSIRWQRLPDTESD